jgi:serine/threonine protein kinase
MALTSGDRFGAYEITELLGVGGMGEVYRARDSRLQRDVALKVLPDERRLDPESLQRFEREARLLASLNHPNIATLHGIETAGGAHALVMEVVDGETLDDRLARAARKAAGLPLREALEIARQIAEALDAAHERGVVHRDLKPANVKIRPDGTVKVLDFGIAKVFETHVGGHRGTTIDVTQMPGAVIGTPSYMSPEQATGGLTPRWRADGKELFYMTRYDHAQVMAVGIDTSGGTLVPGVPQELFDWTSRSFRTPRPCRTSILTTSPRMASSS